MTKKVQKKYRIPKYGNGTAAAAAQPLIQPQAVTEHKAQMMSDALNREYGITSAKSSAKSGIGSGWGGAIGAAGTAVGKYAMNALGVEENSQVGQTFGTSMEMAELGGSIVPGWGHLIGGVVGLGMGALKKGSVDKYGNITYGGIWGRSKRSLQQESNRKKNSLLAQEQTANMQAEFVNNNPNVEPQPAALAAEGGVMRRSVQALVSKGEVIYDPETGKLMKVPGSKGKPNKKDDVRVQLKEGDIVLSNSPDLLVGGKTISDFVSSLVSKDIKKKTRGNQLAIEANVKKALHMQESMKAARNIKKPQNERGVLTASKGDPSVGITTKNDRKYKGDTYVSQNEEIAARYRNQKFVNAVKDYLKDDVAVENAYNDLKDLPQMKRAMAKYNNDKRKALLANISDGKYGNVQHYFNEEVLPSANIDASGKVVIPEQYTPDFSNYYKEFEKGVLKPGEKMKIKSDGPIVIDEQVEEDPLPTKQKNSFNLGDFGDIAYKAASVLTPLSDREKADPVNYKTPVAKYRPTGINVDPSLRAINDAYAQARYNQQNISTNTGAGMAYGLQAAMNRGKQMADVYAWQQNAQNELIGRNVDTYNQWSRDYSNIMNDVYNKTAANVAAARNINRQNRATALNNWGQIRKDAKQYEMDKLKIAAASPMWKYGMENYDELMKTLNS